jgi:uncharacterized protein (DUF2336 family)
MRDTRGCLLELERLATDGSRERRDELLERVTDLFFLTSEQQSPAEKAVFGAVIKRIAYELEVKVRTRLAERLSEADCAPHELIVKLATDVIGVARPVLEKSPVLKDQDLIHIAGEHGQDHLHAISNRTELNSAVTDALVKRGNDFVLAQLAENHGAVMSSGGLKRLSERAGSSSELYSALEMRTDIPKETLAEIKGNIASRLKSELVSISSDISAEDVNEIVEERATEMNLQPADQMRYGITWGKKKGVTEKKLSSFARARKLAYTTRCLSLMCGISVSRVSDCILKDDISALAILCKSGNLKSSTFAALLQLRPPTGPDHEQIIADAIRHYEMLTTSEARRAMQSSRNRLAQADPE